MMCLIMEFISPFIGTVLEWIWFASRAFFPEVRRAALRSGEGAPTLWRVRRGKQGSVGIFFVKKD